MKVNVGFREVGLAYWNSALSSITAAGQKRFDADVRFTSGWATTLMSAANFDGLALESASWRRIVKEKKISVE